MNRRDSLSISDFAKLSRTTRKTLLHYDKIGLLTPMTRGDNKYRYYSIGQIAGVNLIRTMQELGKSLLEIKTLKKERSPKNTSKVLEDQIEGIDEKIEDWIRARKLLYVLKQTIDAVTDVDEDLINVQFLSAEAIVLGGLNDYSRERNEYDALLSFYEDIDTKYPNMDTNYPVWAVYSKDRVCHGDWRWPDRYYMTNPEGYDRKPAGLYAIGYLRGGYGQSSNLYKRLLEYIDNNDYEVYGNAYEEYPLNELCIPSEDDYLMRILIAVQKKTKSTSGKNCPIVKQ